VERSFDSVDVFVQADDHMLSDDPYHKIHEMYRCLLAKELANVPIKTVYMKTNPTKCLSRIASRARPGEDGITADYLAILHRVHEEKFGACDVCVDANQSLDVVVKQILQNIANDHATIMV
jgi:deoxyadenosine/deoxycytidine kinase